MSRKSSRKNLPNKSLAELSVLVIGTTCCDMINPEFDFLDDIAGDGLVVDSSRMVQIKPEWLETKKLSYAMGGGSLNIAPLVSKAGTRAGILTSFGLEKGTFDIHGRFMLDIMNRTGAHPLIVPNSSLPSGASFIHPAEPGRRESILHAPNAVDGLDLESEEIFGKICGLKVGAIIHYVYSGAAKTMDKEKGRKLGRVMERLRSSGYITIVDPHTLSKNPQESIRKKEPIKGYNLLRPVLPHLSWFFASEAEAMMTANTFGYSLRMKNQEDKIKAYLLRTADDFFIDHSPRIIGITAGTQTFIMYQRPDGNRVGPVSVRSRYTIADADKFVGAGDSFRAGFEVEWTKGRDYSKKFKAASIKENDLERLCLAGHLMAACYVTRTPSDQYGNIPSYLKMAEVIDSEKVFPDKKNLLSALDIQQGSSLHSA
ncbi:MAG: carbohydrate kinase family protein [Candidatus Aminicenantes bacterium]|nr:carbohydrate kinase family protein [Candidatus Aminicenantes bacterium]